MEGFSGLAGEPSAPSRHVRGDDRPARAEHRRVHRGRQHGDRRLRRSRARPDAAHPRLARLRSDHRRRRGQRPPAQRVDLPRRQGPAAFARAADHDLAVARLRVRRDREGAVAAQRREDAQLCDQPVRASAVRPSRHRRFDPVHDRRVHARMPEFVDRRPVRRYVRYTRPAHRHPQRHLAARTVRVGARRGQEGRIPQAAVGRTARSRPICS